MGGIMRTLTGGSKQKSKQSSTSTNSSDQFSLNRAYEGLVDDYAPTVQQGNDATSMMYSLLGLGGDAGSASDAYNRYLKSTDFQSTMDEGSRAITNNAAARGMLGSGATLKRLTQFGQENAQKYFGDFLQRLLGLTEVGQRAGQLISGAGGFSRGQQDSASTSTGKSSGSSVGGLVKFLE